MTVALTDKEIDITQILADVSSPSAGAIATFIGTTRNYTTDKEVTYLDYEAYDSMAISMMEEVCLEAKRDFDIEKISMVHRLGKVVVEETSVFIAVSAGHRKAAFEACQFAINRLKEIVPIWKKEFMADGSEKWIANSNP